MAKISILHKNLPFRHVQGDAHTHLLLTRGGKSVGGKGYGCWFWTVGNAISEVPLNDQNAAMTLKGRTKDFQEVIVTSQAWFTVADAEKVAGRFDFSVSVESGDYNADPLTVINGALTSAAQESVWTYIAGLTLAELLSAGLTNLGETVFTALDGLDFGVTVSRVSIMQVRPADMKIENSLQAETREKLQLQADTAVFARRASATDQERAIEEANLRNQLELAKQRTAVIAINDTNARREAEAAVESARIKSEGEIAIEIRKANENLAQRAKSAAENLRIEEARKASELRSKIADDAQAASQKANLLQIELEIESKRVALLATPEGVTAAQSMAQMGLPLALSNVRVLGQDGIQTVLDGLFD